MTNEEINKALHESKLVGGCWHISSLVMPLLCDKCEYVGPPESWNPNYCGDLNAMAKVEEAMHKDMGLQNAYERTCWNVLKEEYYDDLHNFRFTDSFRTLTFPPQVRARAALQIVSKESV